MRMMVFGCGYSGRAIARAAMETGAKVFGTSRTGEKAEALAPQGVEAFVFDGTAIDQPLEHALSQVTHLVQSIPPGAGGDPVLSLASDRLAALCPRLTWVGYLSTIGVYGDQAGGWVDEETPCNPAPGRSRERVEAEKAWLAAGEAIGVPVAVLRLSGIYGPGRNAFVNLKRGTARRIVKKDQVFNRIRVEDIARAALFLAQSGHGGTFNVTDDEPAAPQDVIAEAARLMGVEPPTEQPFETAEMTAMARSFYGSNKRVSNKRISDLGFQFLYPDYRMSLNHLWVSRTWDGELPLRKG